MDTSNPPNNAKALRFTRQHLMFTSMAITGILFAIVFWIPYIRYWASFGWDWFEVFKPAILATLRGGSPYAVEGFYSPPWLLLLMSPFTLIPSPFDLYAIIAASIGVFVFVMLRLNAPKWIIPLFFLIPQIWWSILDGNVDFLVALGFVLPPQIGLILVLLKPQLGAAMAVFWAVEAFRESGIRAVIRLFAPVAAIIALSFALFGWWPAYLTGAAEKYWNVSNWPYMLPVALLLLYRAVRDRRQGLAITAGPFLSPYLHAQSLPLAVLGLMPNEVECVIAIASLWVIWFVRGIH